MTESNLLRIIDTQREQIRQLEELLVPQDRLGRKEWGLSPKEARVFAHLTTRPVALKGAIMHALYADRHPDEEPEVRIIDAFVYKLRKKLQPYGVTIETVWGQGYSLVDREQYLPKPVSVAREDLQDLLRSLAEQIEQGQIDDAKGSIADILDMVGALS